MEPSKDGTPAETSGTGARATPPRPEQDRFSQLGDWAQSLLSRANQARSVLSPWVQRSMEIPSHSASLREPARGPGIGAGQRQMALSELHTRTMLGLVDRKVEGGRVWHPDVGSVAPETFERFAGEIVQRHPTFERITQKYLAPSPEEGAEEGKADFVLAPVGGVAPSVQSSPLPDAAAAEAAQFELGAAWPEVGFVPTFETSAPGPSQPPPWAQPPKTIQRKPGVRPQSRIEEITPGGKTPGDMATAERPRTGIEQEEGPARALEEAAPSGGGQAPVPHATEESGGPPVRPTVPTVQHRLEEGAGESREPEREEGPAPATEEAPPRPAAGREAVRTRAGVPTIQRQAEEELPAPPPASVEAAQPVSREAPAPHATEVSEGSPVRPAAPTIQRRVEKRLPPPPLEEAAQPVSREAPALHATEGSGSPSVQSAAPTIRPHVGEQLPVPSSPSVEAAPSAGREAPVPHATEGSGGPPVRPAAPTVQRRVEERLPSPPPPSAEAALPVSREALVPHTSGSPPVRPAAPAVQRQAEEQLPAPPPPSVEAAPPVSQEAPVPHATEGSGGPPVRPAAPTVQRQVEEQLPAPPREEAAPPISREAPVSHTTEGSGSPPVRPAAPTVQRQVEEQLPAAPREEAAPPISREAPVSHATEGSGGPPVRPVAPTVQRRVEEEAGKIREPEQEEWPALAPPSVEAAPPAVVSWEAPVPRATEGSGGPPSRPVVRTVQRRVEEGAGESREQGEWPVLAPPSVEAAPPPAVSWEAPLPHATEGSSGPPMRPAAPTIQRRVEERAVESKEPEQEKWHALAQEEAAPPLLVSREAPVPPVTEGSGGPPSRPTAPTVQRRAEEAAGESREPERPERPVLTPPSAETAPPVGQEAKPARPAAPAVQRRMEARAEPPAAAQESEQSMVPPAKARPPHIPPAAPPQVQRQVGPAESDRSLSRDRGDAGLVASAEQAEWYKATAGLDEDVLVRAASKARPPLIEPGPPTVIREDLTRIRPVEHVATLPQARLQARFEESPPGEERAATEPASASLPAPDRTRFYTPSSPPPGAAQLPLRESVAVTVRAPSTSPTRSPETPVTSVPEAQRSGRGQAPVAELPLPPIGRSATPQVVQRQPSPEVPGIGTAGSRGRGEWVQRVATKGRVSGQSAEEEEKPDLDLDHLARQIYPILKRMLAVERERRSGR